MTESMAIRTVRKADERPLYHFPYKSADGKRYRKPVATVLEEMLLKQVPDDPRAHLVVGIIAQAARDALNPSWNIPKYQYEDSFRFFRDGRLESMADLVGLEADYVRRLIVEAVGGDLTELGAQ